jgi:hypothetical protein
MQIQLMKRVFHFILPSLFIFAACESDPLKIEVDDVKVSEMQVLRLDEDLFSIKASTYDQQMADLKKKYGSLFEHYLMNPLRLNGSADTAAKTEILHFINDREVRGAWKQSQTQFQNIDDLTQQVAEMRKRYHVHFPNNTLPSRLMTCLSGWNFSVAYMDSTLILSLDMYLGDTSSYYQMLRYPQYQTRRMNRAHIMPDLARGWLLSVFDNDSVQNTLLHHTIFYGKLFYAVQALLPETADSLVIGYTTQQLKTCTKYEKQYWSYFAEKNRLFENSLMNIRELTSEGPFTAAISKDCPPRIAMWVGWQIVRQYMKKNKVSLEELMNEKDPQKILSKSKYRP